MESMESLSHLNIRRTLVYFIAFALPTLSSSLIAWHTNSVWEDGLITLRQSINWVEGRGLTYNPSEIVQGYTSTLGMLLLALFYKLFAQSEPLTALYVYRALSILILGCSGVLIVKLFSLASGKLSYWSLYPVLLLSLDFKAMLFSINGQEPAFTALFILLALIAAIIDSSKCRICLMSLATLGLQLNRPEGFVYICAVMFGDIFRLKPENRFKRVKQNLLAISIAITLYLPWLIFATLYYGNPIPNTIYAKGAAVTWGVFFDKLLPGLIQTSAIVLGPTYFIIASWPLIAIFSLLSVLICSFCWIISEVSEFTKFVSIAALLSLLYLVLVAATSHNYPWSLPFPWYFISVTLFVHLTLGSIFSNSFIKETRSLFKKICLSIIPFFIICPMIGVYRYDYNSSFIRQAFVENMVRRPIGEWLKQHISQDDTVFTECFGYIGFYSNAHILDYPGLVSKRVVELRRSRNLDFFGLFNELQPNWLVLRFSEAEIAESKSLLNNYDLVKVFEISQELDPSGQARSYFDAAFKVFKKNQHDKKNGLK